MIDKYLERGDMFALYDNGLKSICVVTGESSDTCELKISLHMKRGTVRDMAAGSFSIYQNFIKISIRP